MAELSQEDLHHALLPITARLDGLDMRLSNVASETTKTATISADMQTRTRAIQESLDHHTASLDGIARNTMHWLEEAAALRSAIDRHETFLIQLAKKLGLKFN